ncbi:hypothetical protein Cus16_1071 [Curtobacterium sp. ER1/6]|nr:hypothetical protein Cus16_1071 [Curtobacterium sp. ER1/6]
MFTGPSAKYTAISIDPGARAGTDGSRRASSRRLRRDATRRWARRMAVRMSFVTGMVVLRVRRLCCRAPESLRSDDRRATRQRHPADGQPPHRVRRSAVGGPALAHTGEPGAQSTGVSPPARDLDRGPRADVQRTEHRGQVAPGEEHPVPGVQPDVLGVPRGVDRGVVGDEVPGVPGASTGVPDAPRELDALVRVEVRRTPAADRAVDVHRQDHGALPHGEHRRRVRRCTLADARHPAAGVGDAGRVDHPRLHETERRVPFEQRDGIAQEGRRRDRGVVVEEEHVVAVHDLGAGVATGRDPDVLGQCERTHALRQTGGRPAVADADDVELDVLLCEDALQAPAEVVRPGALRQADDRDAGPLAVRDRVAPGRAGRHARTRFDEMIARKCPAVARTASGSSAPTRIRSASGWPITSPSRAKTNARIDSSTEWYSRWNGRKRAALRSDASRRPEGTVPASRRSTSFSSPAFARATCTMSLSALLSTITSPRAQPMVVHIQSAPWIGHVAARTPSAIGISPSVV